MEQDVHGVIGHDDARCSALAYPELWTGSNARRAGDRSVNRRALFDSYIPSQLSATGYKLLSLISLPRFDCWNSAYLIHTYSFYKPTNSLWVVLLIWISSLSCLMYTLCMYVFHSLLVLPSIFLFYSPCFFFDVCPVHSPLSVNWHQTPGIRLLLLLHRFFLFYFPLSNNFDTPVISIDVCMFRRSIINSLRGDLPTSAGCYLIHPYLR